MVKKKRTKKTSINNLSEPIIISPNEAADEDSVAYQVMDAADQRQMLESAEGNFSELGEALVYKFVKDGQEVTGLSWVGTKEAAATLAREGKLKLSITELDYTPDPIDDEYMIFKAKAYDKVTERSTICVKRQWLLTTLPDGKTNIKNVFWLEQGSSKVKRNAQQELMPASFIQKIIKQWLEQGKYITLGAPKEGAKGELPTDPKAIKKIKIALDTVNAFKTKKDLLAYESKLLQSNEKRKKYDGKELYTIRQAIKAKVGQLKK